MKQKRLLAISALCIFGFSLSTATAADYQPCTAIKAAKDRLSCFDKYAASQTAETNAANAAAKLAADEKAKQDAAAASEQALILAEVERFKTVLTERFKDPSSAQLKNVVAYANAGSSRITSVCGLVNAKNSYGAYTGYKRFFMIGTSSVEIEDPKNTYVIDQMWPSLCTGPEVYRQK